MGEMMITSTTDPGAATLSPVERDEVLRVLDYIASTRQALPLGIRDEAHALAARLRAPVAPAPIEPGVIEALEIIAGKRQCIDNLMSHADVARAALAAFPKPAPAGADPCLQGPGTTPPFAIPRDPNFRAPAPADTVPVSREWLEQFYEALNPARLRTFYPLKAFRAEIDRLLAEGAR